MATDELAINLPDIEAEIKKLTPSEMVEQLTKMRVRQKVQQKKHYNPEAMKAYQQKQREKNKLLKERALNTPATMKDPATHQPFANLWEQINHVAEQQAEAKLQEQAGAEVDEQETA